MARKRPAPGASGHDAGELPRAARTRTPTKHERLGPLAVERHVKDDGRALILYTDARAGRRDASCASTSCAASRSTTRSTVRSAPSCPRASTARSTPRFRAGPPTEIPFPSFEIAVFDNRFPAFDAASRRGRGGRLHRQTTTAPSRTLTPQRAEDADVGLAPPLPRARRARGRRLRVHLREPRRRGRRHAAPPPRPDLRLPVHAARARARAGRRRAPRRLRAVLAARRRAARTAGASSTRTTPSSPTSRSPRAGPTKSTSSCASTGPACSTASRTSCALLAAALQALVRGYDALFDRPFPYVMAVHQAPTAGRRSPDAAAGRGASRAGTCTSSSIRRCARPRSSSTWPAPSRAPARSSPTRCPRSLPPSLREAIARAA